MMKLKKELILIALAIVLLIGYLSVRETDRNEYRLPDIAKITVSDITRIEIARPEGTVVLEKKDSSWQIQPQAYLADSGKVNTILSDLEKLSLTAMVSESRSYTRYDLDPDKAIRIKAWAGQELKRDLQVGKPATTFQHTFVRMGDGAEVYHAWQNLRTAFDQTADKLRDKTVLAFSLDEVKEIAVTRYGNQTVFRKSETAPAADAAATAPAQQVRPAAAKTLEEAPPADSAPKPAEAQWVTDAGKAADLSKMNKLLFSLSRLSCESFLDGKSVADFGTPISSIVIKGKKDYTLTIYTKTDKDAKDYPASSSESAAVFILSDRQADQVIADPEALVANTESVRIINEQGEL